MTLLGKKRKFGLYKVEPVRRRSLVLVRGNGGEMFGKMIVRKVIAAYLSVTSDLSPGQLLLIYTESSGYGSGEVKRAKDSSLVN
jgi:hypothetical protein